MTKRLIALFLLLILPVPAACAEYWDEDWLRPVVCCEDRIGCQVLQMVMMGSFDSIDPDNRLSIRVLSAAYPKLKSVSQDDISNFMEEFDVDEQVLRTDYYIALACCLWADILMGECDDPQEEEARQVLLPFLDPASDETNGQQIEMIRAIVNEEIYAEFSQRTGLKEDFLRYLIESKNWHDGITVQ